MNLTYLEYGLMRSRHPFLPSIPRNTLVYPRFGLLVFSDWIAPDLRFGLRELSRAWQPYEMTLHYASLPFDLLPAFMRYGSILSIFDS